MARNVRKRFLFLLLAVSLLTAYYFALPSPARAAPSDEPDNTVQTDGRVSAVLLVGDRIYLGGTFLHVNGVPRTRLAAIDANTGNLTSWNPGANSWVMALAASPDGSRIYAGGAFSRIGIGRDVHRRVAAIDPVTGRADNTWNPRADAPVRSLAVLGNNVYMGGQFLSVNGQSRPRLAMVSALGGTLDGSWRPGANDVVRKLSVSADGSRIYAGGFFTTISGLSRPNLVSLNPVTGAPSAWRPNPRRPVIDLAPSGTRVYTAEGGPGGAVRAYDAGTGGRLWSLFADGDAQTITVFGNRVYVGGHYDVLGGQTRRKLAAVVPATGALDSQWTPRTDRGIWDLTPDVGRGRLYAGGDFTRINGRPQRGFAQFSDSSVGNPDPDPGPDPGTAETQTLTATADAKIVEDTPNENYGGVTSLVADGDAPPRSGRDEAVLIEWDLSGVAPGTQVDSASVTLTVTNSSSQTYEAYDLAQRWTEFGVTWNRRVVGEPWQLSGAKGALDRRGVVGTLTPSTTGQQTFVLPPSLVERWIDDPTSNHGIVIADETNWNGFDFRSRETSNQGQRPRLTVDLQTTSP